MKSPYDSELKQLVKGFASLIRPIIATIDRYGLKSQFLREHLVFVESFYKRISQSDPQSDVTRGFKDRFEKNRDKLFTFLNYDGVPWHNNNAEHAIKALAKLRQKIDGHVSEKSIGEYLVLLSVCETCKYRGLDFLDFLRSGEKDIDTYAAKLRKRGIPLCGSELVTLL